MWQGQGRRSTVALRLGRVVLSLVVVWIVAGAAPAGAAGDAGLRVERQSGYSAERRHGGWRIAMAFDLAGGSRLPLSFEVPAPKPDSVIDRLARYDPAEANRRIKQTREQLHPEYESGSKASLKAYVESLRPSLPAWLDVSVSYRAGGIRVDYQFPASRRAQVTGIRARIEPLIRREQDRYHRQYLADNAAAESAVARQVFESYGLIAHATAPGRVEVYADYPALARDGVAELESLAVALAPVSAGRSERVTAQLVADVVQSIPYSDIVPRGQENLVGLLGPSQVVVQNRGDCDSKAVAFAALAHTLLPGRTVIMVTTADHAFVGIDLPPARGDDLLDHDGRRFVLAEVAGPAITGVGSISPESRADLRRGRINRVFVLAGGSQSAGR